MKGKLPAGRKSTKRICGACGMPYSSPNIQKGTYHKYCGGSPRGRFGNVAMSGVQKR